MVDVRMPRERSTKKKADVSHALERSERTTPLGVSAAITDETPKMGNMDIPAPPPLERGKLADFVSFPAGARANGERRPNGHTVEPAAWNKSWRDKHDRVYKHGFPQKNDTKRFDRRWAGGATFHASQREEVTKPLRKRIEGTEDESATPDVAATHLCYVKMLISNQLAGMIIGNTGQEVKRLKEATGAKIVLSPHGTYFPGTSERLVSAEGKERSVFQVIDWIIDRMHELAIAKAARTDDKASQLNIPGKMRGVTPEIGKEDATYTSGSAARTLNGVASSLDAPSSQCSAPLSCKLCVPRAVVGSLIGRQGGYIQSVRVATEANINISPLFVTADEACAERIITIESPCLQSLRTATFTLARKINSHPEKATCKHMSYYRKFSFDPSPLALIEGNRRERVSSRLASTELRTTTGESQSRLVSAESESCVGSAESLEQVVSLSNQRNHSFIHRNDPLFEGNSLRIGLTTTATAAEIYRHSVPTEDVTNERDVSSFSAASTATSATKLSSPFVPSLRRNLLSNTESSTPLRPVLSSLSTATVAAVRSATGSSLGACKIADEPGGSKTLPSSLSPPFFTHARPDATRSKTTEDVMHAVTSTAAARPCSSMVGRNDHLNQKIEHHSQQEGISQPGQSQASNGNVQALIYTLGCSETQDSERTTNSLANYHAVPHNVDTKGGLMGNESNIGGSGELNYPDICSVQMRRDQEESSRVGVPDETFERNTKTLVDNRTSCPSGMFAEEQIPLATADEAPFIPYALSYENLSSVCSTAAGSIATLTTILQGIHGEVPNQQANTARSGITTSQVCDRRPPYMKNGQQEAYAMALQLCKTRQFEQLGASAPGGFATNELQSAPPPFDERTTSDTQLAAAAAPFANVVQNRGVTESGSVAAIPRATLTEAIKTVLDPAAAEFFPCSFTLPCPFQHMRKDGNPHKANTVLTEQETVNPSQKSTSEQSRRGVLQQCADVTVGTDTIRQEDNVVNETATEENKPACRNLQRLLDESGVNLTISSAMITPVNADSVPAVVGVAENNKNGRSEQCAVLTISDTHTASTEQCQQMLPSRVDSSVEGHEATVGERSRVHSSVDEQKATVREMQHVCDSPGIAGAAEQEATEPVQMRTMMSDCRTHFSGLAGIIPKLAIWIPSLFECNRPAFMTFWTTAFLASLVGSAVFTYLRSP